MRVNWLYSIFIKFSVKDADFCFFNFYNVAKLKMLKKVTGRCQHDDDKMMTFGVEDSDHLCEVPSLKDIKIGIVRPDI